MNKKEPVAFTVAVTIDRNKANCIDVMTEPCVGSTVLAALHDMLVGDRDTLTNGSYTLTYTVEDGCRVEGPDQASGATMKRRLSEDMAALTGALEDVTAVLAIEDDRLVEGLAGTYARAVLDVDRIQPGFVLKPGFVDILSGCPTCGGKGYLFAKELFALRSITPENDEQRTALEARVAALEREELPKVGFLTMFADGVECQHPFASFANQKLASRYREIGPRVEQRTIALLREAAERSTARVAGLKERLAAWS